MGAAVGPTPFISPGSAAEQHSKGQGTESLWPHKARVTDTCGHAPWSSNAWGGKEGCTAPGCKWMYGKENSDTTAEPTPRSSILSRRVGKQSWGRSLSFWSPGPLPNFQEAGSSSGNPPRPRGGSPPSLHLPQPWIRLHSIVITVA